MIKYIHGNKELSPQSCETLLSMGDGKWNQGTTGDAGAVDKTTRKSDIVWLDEQWVTEMVWPYMEFSNEQGGWKYDIASAENYQLTRYAKDDFYSWHIDGMGSHNELFGSGITRKLSMTIVLNSDFEGGELEIKGAEVQVPRLEKGSIVVFPSFCEHRITPVTKGTRHALVAWFVGPPFR